MNEDGWKVLSILFGMVLCIVAVLTRWSLLIPFVYLAGMFMGAYARGENWILGWREVKYTGKKVR